jgi:hypothetical protein
VWLRIAFNSIDLTDQLKKSTPNRALGISQLKAHRLQLPSQQIPSLSSHSFVVDSADKKQGATMVRTAKNAGPKGPQGLKGLQGPMGLQDLKDYNDLQGCRPYLVGHPATTCFHPQACSI